MADFNFRWYFLGAFHRLQSDTWIEQIQTSVSGVLDFICSACFGCRVRSGRLVSVGGNREYAEQVFSELPHADRVQSVVADVFDVDRKTVNRRLLYNVSRV